MNEGSMNFTPGWRVELKFLGIAFSHQRPLGFRFLQARELGTACQRQKYFKLQGCWYYDYGQPFRAQSRSVVATILLHEAQDPLLQTETLLDFGTDTTS